MNILIKLMSIVSLVIAPYLSSGNCSNAETKGDCCKMEQMAESKCEDSSAMIGKCDIKVCATLTKEQCAKMCDSMGCTAEEKAQCMALYNEEGVFIGGKCCKKDNATECEMDKKACCKGDAEHCEKDQEKCSKGDKCCKNKEAKLHEGCSGEKVCAEKNDQTCSKGKACCKSKK